MLEKIKAYLKKWFGYGIVLPLMFDPVSRKPSITLTCTYITFFSAVKCFWDYKANPVTPIPTLIAISFWALSMIFYLIRKITRAKLDIDDRSLELESGSENSEEGDISSDK